MDVHNIRQHLNMNLVYKKECGSSLPKIFTKLIRDDDI